MSLVPGPKLKEEEQEEAVSGAGGLAGLPRLPVRDERHHGAAARPDPGGGRGHGGQAEAGSGRAAL